ncbi:MAG TPA: ATP-dependent helicase [Tepidisphaeraceae bacterium]|nr:ATP-dependent helicase [Tepidisphaeraceae bacterium]
MDAAYLAALNDQQRAAAVAPRESPLLIVAGAGTGKTNTLAHRVAHLIATGVAPARILLLTFTRRAAQEMGRRAERILSEAGGQGSKGAGGRIWSGTFHGIANRLLRLHAQALGLGENFTVIDRSDAEDLLNVCRTELALDKGDVRFPRKGTCLAVYSRCLNAQEPIEDALKGHFPWCQQYPEQLRTLFKSYTNTKIEQNTLDYDDLLLYWYHAMQDEAVAADVRGRFDAVLVDEYQDTNALQAAILKGLCPTGEGLTVVGDDAQSIYSFRAATVHNILEFPQTYPGTTVVKLEQNYRSVQPILTATNAVIALCPKRYNKDLFSTRKSAQKPRLVSVLDEDQQSEHVIKQVLAHHEAGIALKKQAVLFRAAHHSDALEVELARRNIPFVKYGGLKFLEAAHVKDALSFLRLAENPKDTTSAFRVLQLLDGFGPAHAKRAVEELSRAKFDLRAWTEFKPPAAASEQWLKFLELMMGLNGVAGEWGGEMVLGFGDSASPNPPAEAGSPGGTARSLVDQVGMVREFYQPILEKRFDQAHVRGRDLEQLQQIAGGFGSRSHLLSDLTLDPPNSTQDLAGPPLFEEDYLILSTIHSAKGCEWDCVYVLHAADGNIPSDMATGSDAEIEEERRLFYVALTRAKDFLDVVFPLKYYHKKHRLGDKHSYAQLTRFLPEAIVGQFERVKLEPRAAGGDRPGATGMVSDVRKKIAGMWG